ncbi:YwbE family protein [Bacillus paranthracis]|uniref:YwbE family protein n=1 Tax=Bacillus paranthracis TaxID=2026186 RepID=UPI003A807728
MSKKLLLFALMSLCVIALSACKGNEEKLKGAPDEQKVDEDKKVAEEEKNKQEEQQKAEEEKRKQEEQQRVEEEKRKQEEQQKAEEEKRKQEEQQKAEEEKRKQEEQQRAEEEKRKQEEQQRVEEEKPTQATGGKPTRSQISVGSHVVIQLDNDYSKTVSGVVKDILTHSETHTYGIKVRLQDGQIGRVQSVK